MEKTIRSYEDLLNMLDQKFRSPEQFWDPFYTNRERPIPFFKNAPDENLVSYFEKTYRLKETITYIKRDYSNEDFYKNLGFIKKKESSPVCYWIINGIRKHKFYYKTKIQIMHNLGYLRAFDSGNLKFSKRYS